MIYLMYHDVLNSVDGASGFKNESAFQYKLLKQDFENQIRLLRDYEVCFTFDDGGESFITVIAPILEKYSKRGIFFISTKYIGTPGFLSIEQIKELDSRGHVIGSHSHSHPQNISSLSKDLILEEWETSISILSSILGKKIHTASIPNGYESPIVISCAREIGITELFTSKPTTNIKLDKGIRLIGRYVVLDTTSEKLVKKIVSSKVVRLVYLLKWNILKVLKDILGNYYHKVKNFMRK